MSKVASDTGFLWSSRCSDSQVTGDWGDKLCPFSSQLCISLANHEGKKWKLSRLQTLPEVYEETRSCCFPAWLGQCCESDCHPQSLCLDSFQSETFSYLSLPLQNGGDYNVHLEPEDLVSSDM